MRENERRARFVRVRTLTLGADKPEEVLSNVPEE
jgi:hypothetical protein